MLNLNFYRTTRKDFPLKKKEFDKIRNIIKREIKKRKAEIKELNIILVGRVRIKKINNEFLKKNKKTDVISFNLGDTGEIYICSDYVKNKKDLLKLIYHGFLHIMNYDHRTEKERKIMEKLEKKLITETL